MNPTQPSLASAIPGLVVSAGLAIFFVSSMWKVFTKAGEPGWAALIPIFNLYTLIKVAQKPGWYLVLFFVPLVNLVALFLVATGVARAFSKSNGFGVGLMFLPFIFYPVLAFSDAKHENSKPDWMKIRVSIPMSA
jgi:hypothetical protein